jgi:hypothetical protein
MAKITPGRGLDHAVHMVRELDAAAALYERAGFQVGSRNKHPWGTHNRLVQFPSFFVEILTVGEPEKIIPARADEFSFGAFNRDYLARQGDGLSGLVLESKDSAGDRTAFQKAGLTNFPPFSFMRKGKRADGSETEVGFELVFTREQTSPNMAFFTCRQTHPENFWSEKLQNHPNGAVAIKAAVLTADNPTDHHIFLSAFTGVRDIQASSRGLSIRTPRGLVQALDPRAFKDTFGVEAERDPGLNFAALVFGVRDLGTTETLLKQSGLKFRKHGERLVIGPEEMRGATLAFERS